MQIVLLTLLTSFVTSIATGIVTVTLLDQAPPGFTQTINRVVERTVERVVPDIAKSQGAATASKETTMVVKEEDLITDSIQKNTGALVRIVARPADLPDVSPDVVGMGAVVDTAGHVATARGIFSEGMQYSAVTASGQSVSLKILNAASTSSVAILELGKKEGDPIAPPLKFRDAPSLKLGQTVIALSGGNRTNVSLGIISGLVESLGETATSSAAVAFIETNIASRLVLPGSPILNIFGEGIGIRTASSPDGMAVYIPISVLVAELKALPPAAPIEKRN